MPPRARRGRILAVAIDQKSGQPLYRQIYSHVRQCILDGRLAPGARLPSTRQLAADLRVSRSTAVQAYEQLRAEGYIEGLGGAETRVSGALPDSFVRAGAREVDQHGAASIVARAVRTRARDRRVPAPLAATVRHWGRERSAPAFPPSTFSRSTRGDGSWRAAGVEHQRAISPYGDPFGYRPLA